MPSPRNNLPISSPFVALAAWLVPGAGHYIIGQRTRGLTIGITIVSLFILGLLIGGITVVEMPPFAAGFKYAIVQKPWFVGQALTGPLGIVAAMIARGEVSHARLNEIGTLYTAVAGMLNLLAIIDSTYRASRLGGGA